MAESKTRGRPAIDSLTPSRYCGRLCRKHPELNGLRIRATRECVACHRNVACRHAQGLLSATVRIRREEYNRLLARIAELERRLYGTEQ